MKTVIGNWKMRVGTRESVALARSLLLALRGQKGLPEIVLCPPYVAFSEVHKIVARSHLALGAQDIFWEETGSFTGEISSRMMTELGVQYAIIGHSERRDLFGETNEMVHRKVEAAIKGGIIPIVCVGENRKQRAAGEQFDIVAAQLHGGLSRLKLRSGQKIFIAYEPLWAIGTGQAANARDAVAMHKFIREHGRDILTAPAKNIRVLYGGSIEPENAYEFLHESEIDGVLVGGASVEVKSFKAIIRIASEVLSEN